MSAKASLKAAKAALEAEDYDNVVTEAQKALAADSENYFARVFLGRAYEKQNKLEYATQNYQSAAKLKPDTSTAWLGLCSIYESQGSQKLDEYREAAVKAAEILASADDKHGSQTTIDKFIAMAKRHGSRAQYKQALEALLPGSSLYDLLEGRIQHPSHTYMRIAEMTEQEESERIKQEIGERRTRIGATVGQVTTDVKREVITSSNLESLYQNVINWCHDDEVRRQFEEKLLERAYDVLILLPTQEKPPKLDQVLTLAEGMVIIQHPFQLAWDLVLESRDLEDLRNLDVGILREYIALFPDAGIAKVLQAWLSSELSPFPPSRKAQEEEDESATPRDHSPEDRLMLLTDGLSGAEQSPFVHRLVGDYYLQLHEYDSAVDTARRGLAALSVESMKLGMSMQNTKDALNIVLATALVHHQAPRNHAEATRLFEDILKRKPRATPALIGLGLIMEETEDYHDAIGFFERALNEDEDNTRVATELAWCRALCGDYAQAQQELESYLPLLKADNPRASDHRAQVLYRIGVCIWELDASKSARRDRNGAYARFLAAIKTHVSFAPAYTSLGEYYAEYAKDQNRARQCFQKAFELSAAETYAAERLARFFADQGDWDIVEIIAQRVVDSGRARPPPGSKRKGISWPYSALGVVQMNRQEYQQAIVSFLAALRISPDDYPSYIGLGESYHNSGRSISALRTFNHALVPPEGTPMKVSGGTWFAKYMLANVYRELGDYDKAILGLEEVLGVHRTEFGVLMSLQQTFIEQAARSVETGLFGQAVTSAKRSIATATIIAECWPNAFNMWRALGDGCMVWVLVQSEVAQFPTTEVRALLRTAKKHETFEILVNVDHVELDASDDTTWNGDRAASSQLEPLMMGILAYKRAISACAHDVHAQAVAWYNLGWAENRAYANTEAKAGKRYLRAAVRCFKRAIELEAGNAEFWNALGVVTTTLNPKVAQHAFVRSLYLNELNAKVWANLGVLYLLRNDYELAHQAFSRAQSTDPTYAHAWVGEGLIALLFKDTKEALGHFTHAFEISESTSIISKRQYAISAFDHLLSSPSASNDLTKLIQPVFALEQLRRQVPQDLPYRHLAALYLERIGNHAAAIETLTELCAAAEAEYETSETLSSLARFAHAKSDLARNLLSAHDYAAADENAETALDLTAEADSSGLDDAARRKLRLSSHLTAGLASYYLQKTSAAISMFRTALEESDTSPDIVCLLVKILWARGGIEEKSVAREQLFECVEKHPEHVGSVTLLGVIAALDDDADTAEAVKDDLLSLRTKDGLNTSTSDDIENLLSALVALSGGDAAALTECQSIILLNPNHPYAWSELASQSGDGYAAEMALKTAQKAVPPLGDTQAQELAGAFAGVGTVGDAQRAIALAPWEGCCWEAMTGALE